MSTKVVNYPKGAKPCPVKLSSRSTKKYIKSHHSAWDYYKAYTGSKKSSKTSSATNFLNFFNSFITPALNLVMLGAGIKMNTQNLKNFQQVNQAPTQTTTDVPAEIKLGDETGAKAVQEDLDAMLAVKPNTITTEADKTKALEIVEKNKEAVKKYSDQLLTLSKKEVATDFDTDKDGKISEEEFAKGFTSVDGKQEGAEAELQKQYIKYNFDTLNLNGNQGDKFIDAQEYASHLVTVDTNGNGKIEKEEMDTFLDMLDGKKSKDDITKFQTRNTFIHGLLFQQVKTEK